MKMKDFTGPVRCSYRSNPLLRQLPYYYVFLTEAQPQPHKTRSSGLFLPAPFFSAVLPALPVT